LKNEQILKIAIYLIIFLNYYLLNLIRFTAYI
jgi:hypothetical protein